MRVLRSDADIGDGNGRVEDVSLPEGFENIPRGLPLTDTGNAERFTHWHGRDVLWCERWDKFLAYDGARYAFDFTEETARRATETARRINMEIALEEDEDRRKDLRKHAKASENSGPLKAQIDRLKERVAVSPELFDQDPYLLNCLNGSIDLRTGELRQHRQADHLTKLAPFTYDPDAECPLWLATLHRIFGGNRDVIDFFQRASGYTATADTREQALIFCYGTGQNGKSLVVGTLRDVLGDHARSTRPETLMPRAPSAIPNDVAMLAGARMVLTTEVEEGANLAESLVKQMTGDDILVARFLHGEFFEYRPTFKIWMIGNHIPIIRGGDWAMWRRIHTLPFTTTIPEEEQDRTLRFKLLQEAAGILTWVVKGCLKWQQRGLDPPPEVRAATASYREEMDLMGQFLADCCEVAADIGATSGQLYNRYVDWAQDAGERRPWTRNFFGRKLAERGFLKDRTHSGIFWLGVGVRDDSRDGDEG